MELHRLLGEVRRGFLGDFRDVSRRFKACQCVLWAFGGLTGVYSGDLHGVFREVLEEFRGFSMFFRRFKRGSPVSTRFFFLCEISEAFQDD